MSDESIKEMVEAFERNEKAKKLYKLYRSNPWMKEAKIIRLVTFILVTLLVGTFFMGLMYLAYLVEGGWWWWIKYYCYGLGAIAGYKLSKHENVFP